MVTLLGLSQVPTFWKNEMSAFQGVCVYKSIEIALWPSSVSTIVDSRISGVSARQGSIALCELVYIAHQ